MATGSGLDAQLGYKLESTYGTAVTVDKFQEANSLGFQWEPTFLEPSALRVGTKYKRVSRVVQTRSEVNGEFEIEFATRGMGTLIKWALASGVTTPTLVAGSAYKQVHTPGDHAGKSMTFQVGKPEPISPYTVRPHTYAGCKCVSWTISCSDGEFAKFSASVNGRSEATATALAAATYTPGASVFNFSQANTLKLGGTASTASGETTIASGVTVPGVVTGFSVTADNPMKIDRFGLGNSGLKNEPLENEIPTVTGSLSAEWDRTTWYDAFKANTTTALEIKFEGSVISGSDKDTLSIIIPALKFKSSPFTVDGPDVIAGDVDFEAYSDEVNPLIQVKLISADSTAL